ncbi:MAG: PKD domain-containing protein [Candidatus Thermoplasmatota archaeon]|jgi:PKD repeat protein|nr:PKD domain-containing protein [Candidatus Thermoplasmatota archaeon]
MQTLKNKLVTVILVNFLLIASGFVLVASPSDESMTRERNSSVYGSTEDENHAVATSRANDTEKPVAKAGPDLMVDQGDTVSFNGNGSTDDIAITNYTWTFVDNGPQSLDGIIVNYTFANAGNFIITLNVSDAVGNFSIDTLNVTVRDVTNPVAAAGPDQSVLVGELVTFDGSGSNDNVGVVNFTWSLNDNGELKLFGISPKYTFNNTGTYIVTLNVTDGAGNWALDNLTITVNNKTSPKALIAELPFNIITGSNVIFNASGSEASAGAAITVYEWKLMRFDELLWTRTGKIVNHTFAFGIFDLNLEVTDSQNMTDTASVLILVGELVNFSEIRVELPENGSVVVELGQYIDSFYDEIVNIEWNIEFGSPDAPTLKTLIAKTDEFNKVNQSYSSPGEYGITLNIVTKYGNFTQEATIIIVEAGHVANLPPIPDIKLSKEKVIVKQEFDLDASGSSDLNGSIENYTWDFGDGSSGSGAHVTHSYSEVGTYNITLTVIDNNGVSNSTVINITVEKAVTDFGDKGDPENWSQGDWDRWNNAWLPYVVHPEDDIDNDGFLNYQDDDIDQDGFWDEDELEAGTDPTDPLSYPGKKKDKEETSCTLLIVLVIIFAVVLLLMIVIFSRGRGGPKGGSRPTRKEKDFF